MRKEMSLWSEFLEAWPPDRVRGMSLDQYTNLNRDDAFIYWLEERTKALGSISGGSAFKFGIYRRDQKDPKKRGRGGRLRTTSRDLPQDLRRGREEPNLRTVRPHHR